MAEPESSERTSGYRQRRRAVERTRRRRRTARRLGALGVLFLGLAAVWAGVAALGSDEGEGDAGTASGPGTAGLVLVEVEQAGGMPVAVLLGSEADPTFVLGLPADTLLEGPEGFDPLAELLTAHDPRDLNLDTLVGAEITGSAAVPWEDLRAALPPRGSGGDDAAGEPWPETLEDTPDGAETAAQAFAALAGLTEDDVELEDLVASGDARAFAGTVRALGPAPGVAGRLPGSPVEGAGFAYYEPDPAGVQSLLGGGAGEAAVQVEVQNGSGVAGIAERVSSALEPLAFEMLPSKNAEQFPDVESTRILAAPDVLGQADQVREVLGQGQVVPREDLPAGRIVVVVGKDLSPDSLPAG